MIKKLFAAMIFAFALVVTGQTNVEAAEVYVGSYSDGTAVYLLTETIDRYTRNTSYEVTCAVRAGNDYLQYGFERINGRVAYRNSEGYHGYIDDGSSPVAAAIYRYLRNR
ncbi:MAG: hypothetical protein IJ685_10760 [Selenomonadaceae bacterium]|nr:hypothetical protein [Selenomonadaceae bacterium]